MVKSVFVVMTALVSVWAAFASAQGDNVPPPNSIDDIITKVLQDNQDIRPASPPSQTKTKASSQLPVVMSARVIGSADRTRFVVELSDPLNLRTFTLNNPNRVVIDMPAVQWRLDEALRLTSHGAIHSYRYGLFRPGNARFVLDLNQAVSTSDPLIIPPGNGFGYRVVFDLVPISQSKFDQTVGWPADLKKQDAVAERQVSLPTQSAGKNDARKTIVIDPGHGGIDSGTNGVNGLLERDLVLDEGIRLTKALRRNAKYAVYMTRATDTFIPLGERVNINRTHKADLFISLHADSNPDPSVAGLSVYTLSESGSDKEAAALARKENQSDVIAGVDLGGENSAVAPILIDLEQRDTMNKSSRFAELVVNALSRVTDILPRQPHRSAAFVVLKAPDVPSILIELGYLSNMSDAEQMNTARWRNDVAEAIATAVGRHFAIGEASAPTVAGPVSE
ncbi:MAG: N-acetylmuramoyl-L-alanine amidase [Rhizomicrobium sp.]